VQVDPVERPEQRLTRQEPHRGRHLSQLVHPRDDVGVLD